MSPANEPDVPSLPSFLYGTFNWRIHGLHFESEPPLNLLSPDALNATNPWIVLAAVLAYAKAGDHSHVRRLEPLFYANWSPVISRAALLLVGNLGTERDLSLLEKALHSDDPHVRLQAAKAARFAGSLSLVPAMVHAWQEAGSLDDHDGIGYAVSDLLEPTLGPIADEASIFRLRPTPPADASPLLREYWINRVADDTTEEKFPELALGAYHRLTGQLGTNRMPVWHGAVFGVVEFAEEFLSVIQSDEAGGLLTYRHKFEASTGINCSDFFVDVQPQRLLMQATLEEFLQSNPKARFETGVRYFFGHRIPA